MNNTALGAENKKEQTINFISEAHEKFYYEKLKEVRYQDVYHKALCYCLGISDDTRRNVDSIYDFKTGCVKTECLHEGWQTSGSMKVVRMAFNLYCNGTPSVDDYTKTEEQVNECRQYTVEDLFCCAYAPFFWQAIQIRYPEYATYNRELYGKSDELTLPVVRLILTEPKPIERKVTIKADKISRYFPEDYSSEQIENVIYQLLDEWNSSNSEK